MKKTIIVSLITFIMFSACKDKKVSQAADNNEASKEVDLKKEKTEVENAKFSWDKIPLSSKDIGDFPFIKSPKGIVMGEVSSSTYNKEFTFSKLKMFSKTSNTAFDIEGRVRYISFSTEDENANWEQYYFDKSLNNYLKSIGGVEIKPIGATKGYDEKYWGNEYDGEHTVKHNDRNNIRMWVIKQENRKIGVQIFKKRIAIVEGKEFEQTIEKYTADKILNEINSKGFATLHINFDTGKSRIKTDSYEAINEVAKMMKANSDLKISIEGHTDNIGGEASNMKLSKNRAKSVLMALTDEQIDESRLQSEGFGQTKPIGDNSTEDGKAKNRRVELRKI